MGLDYSQGLSRIAVRNGLPQAFALRCIHVYITQKFRLSPPPPPQYQTPSYIFFSNKPWGREEGGKGGREKGGREGREGGGREGGRGGRVGGRGEGGGEGGGVNEGGRGQ